MYPFIGIINSFTFQTKQNFFSFNAGVVASALDPNQCMGRDDNTNEKMNEWRYNSETFIDFSLKNAKTKTVFLLAFIIFNF